MTALTKNDLNDLCSPNPESCHLCRTFDARSLLPRRSKTTWRQVDGESESKGFTTYGFRYPDGTVEELPEETNFPSSFGLGRLSSVYTRAVKVRCPLCRLIKSFLDARLKGVGSLQFRQRTSCILCVNPVGMVELKQNRYEDEADYQSSPYDHHFVLMRLGVQLKNAGKIVFEAKAAFHLAFREHDSTNYEARKSGLSLIGRDRPLSIPTELVHQWIQKCKEHPGCHLSSRCGYLEHLSSLQLIRLVDVTQNSLKVFHMSDFQEYNPPVYCGLSYVWGTMRQRLSLNGTNLEHLQLPEGVCGCSQTVEDAMVLVKSLGFQYLWVDVLCVLQDDEEDKMMHVSNMHRIFQASSLNILVASQGGSEAGIPGISFNRRIQLGAPITHGFSLYTSASQPTVGRDWLLLQSPYVTRAWTLQEELMSSKALVILDDQICWHCMRGCYFEDLNILLPKNRIQWGTWSASWRVNIDTVYSPDPANNTEAFVYRMGVGGLYESLVIMASRRKVTFEDDMYNAIAGLIKDWFPDTLYGLPTKRLESHLCWRGCSTEIQCIKSSRNTEKGQAKIGIRSVWKRRRGFDGPSWMWAAWKGAVDYACSEVSSGEKLTEAEPLIRAYRMTQTAQTEDSVRRDIATAGEDYTGFAHSYGTYVESPCSINDVPSHIELEDHHLVFWADCGRVWIQQLPSEDFEDPDSSETFEYFALFASDESAKQLTASQDDRASAYYSLNKQFQDIMSALFRYPSTPDGEEPEHPHQRAPKTGYCDFIMMAELQTPLIMLVHYDDAGVAYRDSLHQIRCMPWDWNKLVTERKLVVLG
jgi:hypothetical protein